MIARRELLVVVLARSAAKRARPCLPGALWCLAALALVAVAPGCRKKSGQAASIVAAAKARPGSPLVAAMAETFDAGKDGNGSGGLTARFPTRITDGVRAPMKVTLPARATAPVRMQDTASGIAIDVSLARALPAAGQVADGYVVYPKALESGATVVHSALPTGAEDFVLFEARPPAAEIFYDLQLGADVAGLRLVAGTLEMLDGDGVPRMRAAPPYIVGADGARTDATLAVADCAVDTDPAAPWGRAVTAPGARSCTVKVAWSDAGVRYPAILDPRWTTTGSMTVARQDHSAILLSNGKVLVAGGRSSTGTTGLTSAELFDRTTGTWAATGSMTGGRFLHTATQLNTSSNGTTSGKVLIAGGLNGTTSVNTAQLYDPATGTWAAAGNLNAARHGHVAVRLADGKVLIAGGLNGAATLTSAAIYNPASGTGSWSATTGPLP
ncbi:MAG TPA: kelch repeat-containing protein, partial [Polyangia bacterium]|nr:kelch repeat-containing protein [Polyangia bacterium]